MDTTVVALLRKWASERPDRLAYTALPDRGDPEQVTFAQLDRRARAIAGELQHRGASGARVLLPYPNGLGFITAYLGCLYAGATPVPTPQPTQPFRRTLPRISAIIASSRARFALAPSAVVEVRDELAAEAPACRELEWIAHEAIDEARAGQWHAPAIDARTIALLQYTSGSTATPKGVMVSHGNLLQSCKMMDLAWHHDADSIIVSWLPVFHDMGLVYGTMMPLYKGFHGVSMTPESFVRRPARWLEAFTHYRGTHTIAPNFGYELCIRKIDAAERARLDLASWRVAASGAEPIRKDTMLAFVDAFAPHGLRPSAMTNAYGLAEGTLAVTGSSLERPPSFVDVRRADLEADRIVASAPGEASRTLVGVGIALADTTIAIVDPETHRRCAPDRVGEVWVGGPTVAHGYLDLPEETERTFAAHIAETGEGPFLRTGDLGFLRDGELFICGRLKDLVIIRGRNHHPVDIEATVERGDATIRPGCTAAFSIDEGGEEQLVIVAELKQDGRGADFAAIRERIRRDVVFHHEVEPARIVLARVSAVPKTSSGKIQRAGCRARLLAGTLSVIDETGGALEADLLGELARLARRRPGELDASMAIHQLGIDSVKVVELAAFLERTHGIVVPISRLLDDVSIGQLARDLAGPPEPRRQLAAEPAARSARPAVVAPPVQGLQLSLFYFANDDARAGDDRYRLLLESAKLGDARGFHALWIPERHFHPFGGVFPNPSVAAAALSTITSRIRLRAGSVVLPLHDPLRVAEEWALVDNLSRGRVDLAFASGWAANDFVLMPHHFAERRAVNLDGIETVKRLWRGEALARPNGTGAPFEARIFPQPLQPELSSWLTCTGGIDGFVEAGARGHHVLTALLFQSIDELAAKIAVYRQARAAHGHDRGRVTLMLHTFLGESVDDVRRLVRDPFVRYLESSIDLWRHEFAHLEGLAGSQRRGTIDAAFERYFARNALFGTPATCLDTVARLVEIGIDEIACLIDFGLPTDTVLRGLDPLDELRRLAQGLRPRAEVAP